MRQLSRSLGTTTNENTPFLLLQHLSQSQCSLQCSTSDCRRQLVTHLYPGPKQAASSNRREKTKFSVRREERSTVTAVLHVASTPKTRVADMPNSRHQRNQRQKDEDAHNNNRPAAAIPAVHPREVAAGAMAHNARQYHDAEARQQKCCTPGSCRLPDETIDPEEPFDAVKVLCNNENCKEGCWMHKDCFEDFEQSVLSYLRSCGRARSWSEKQRLQNLWTKKGYDLAFKACDCKCSRGHLRKDLDYIPPPFNDNAKKQKKHKKKNDKPMPVVSTTHKSNSHSNHLAGHGNSVSSSSNHGDQHIHGGSTGTTPRKSKRTNSTSHTSDKNSTVGQSDSLGNHSNHTNISTTMMLNSPPNSAGSGNVCFTVLPANAHRLRTNSVSSTGSVGSHTSSISSIPSSAGSASPISSSPISGDLFFKARKSSDASSENGLTSSSGFWKRPDMSAFALLPRNKQNPYNIRMEDASTLAHTFSASCSVGAAKSQLLCEIDDDTGVCDVETRNFVLTNLLNKKMSSSRCVLCKVHLPVFDKFPLLDGTFFLSPQSYDELAIQVIWDGRLQFLNAACLACLEGRNNIRCVACKRPWNGQNLVVGSMYTYDIFAAMPCCQKRLTCKCCRRAVVDVTKGLDFYSQYSQMNICPYCKANDYHFIRSLAETFLVSEEGAELPAPICQ